MYLDLIRHGLVSVAVGSADGSLIRSNFQISVSFCCLQSFPQALCCIPYIDSQAMLKETFWDVNKNGVYFSYIRIITPVSFGVKLPDIMLM